MVQRRTSPRGGPRPNSIGPSACSIWWRSFLLETKNTSMSPPASRYESAGRAYSRRLIPLPEPPATQLAVFRPLPTRRQGPAPPQSVTDQRFSVAAAQRARYNIERPPRPDELTGRALTLLAGLAANALYSTIALRRPQPF